MNDPSCDCCTHSMKFRTMYWPSVDYHGILYRPILLYRTIPFIQTNTFYTDQYLLYRPIPFIQTNTFYTEQYLLLSYLTRPLRWKQVIRLKEERVWCRDFHYAPALKKYLFTKFSVVSQYVSLSLWTAAFLHGRKSCRFAAFRHDKARSSIKFVIFP